MRKLLLCQKSKNIESRWHTGFGSGDNTEQCFDIPKGYAEVTIRYWHVPDQMWVEQETEFKMVDGVKQVCADVQANGWVALQGKHTEGIYGCVSNGNVCPNLPEPEPEPEPEPVSVFIVN